MLKHQDASDIYQGIFNIIEYQFFPRNPLNTRGESRYNQGKLSAINGNDTIKKLKEAILFQYQNILLNDKSIIFDTDIIKYIGLRNHMGHNLNYRNSEKIKKLDKIKMQFNEDTYFVQSNLTIYLTEQIYHISYYFDNKKYTLILPESKTYQDVMKLINKNIGKIKEVHYKSDEKEVDYSDTIKENKDIIGYTSAYCTKLDKQKGITKKAKKKVSPFGSIY